MASKPTWAPSTSTGALVLPLKHTGMCHFHTSEPGIARRARRFF